MARFLAALEMTQIGVLPKHSSHSVLEIIAFIHQSVVKHIFPISKSMFAFGAIGV
jgi:hypothetical protein